VFQFFQASWVIQINSFFEKSPQKEVYQHKVSRLWRPKTTPNNALSKELLQKSVHSVGHRQSRASLTFNTVWRRTCFLSQTLAMSQNGYQLSIVALFGTFLSGFTLLNASRTAANNFKEKKCLRMNTCSAHECTMFAPAQLLRSWCEQRPSNKNDLGSSDMQEAGVELLLISFLYRST
jgi:hypothetical protein